jgi:hypothetical protein
MAQTNIYVGVKGEQTASGYKVEQGDHIKFHNVGPADLNIRFEDMPLCAQGGNPADNPLVVAAGGSSAKLTVCKGPKVGNYPFANQITGFAAEDPIVIIEMRGKLTNPIVIIEVIAGAVLLLVGYLLGRWHANRKMPASTGRG